MNFDKQKFAENEIKLAKFALAKNDMDRPQQNRLVYWLAYLQRFSEITDYEATLMGDHAVELATKAKVYVARFRKLYGR